MTVPVPVVVGFAGGLILVLVLLLALLFHTGPQGAGGASVNLAALRDWLEGKKTYLGMVLLAVNNYAARRGWIDGQLASDLNLALGTLTGIAFVAKNNRIEQKVDTATTAAKLAAIARPKEGI